MKPFNQWQESTKIMLIRMWLAGAVCFFGAWGFSGPTIVESGIYSIQLVSRLIVLLVLTDFLLLRPVVNLMFKNGETKKINEPFYFVLLKSILHLTKITVIVVAIVFTYNAINKGLIFLFNLRNNTISIPLEPILFGILYGFYFEGCNWVTKNFLLRGKK